MGSFSQLTTKEFYLELTQFLSQSSFSSASQPVIEILACLYLQFVISCSFSLHENFPKGDQAIVESFVCCEFQPLQTMTYIPSIDLWQEKISE